MQRFLWLVAFLAVPGIQAAEPTPALSYYQVQGATQAGWGSSDAKVEAVRETLLSAQVPGAIVALPVKAGDQVKAGQELTRIDARMASQGAAASNAQVAAAQASLHLAGKEYERQKQLFAKRYISQAALDSAEAQWRATQAQVAALQAQAGVAATQTGLHSVKAPYSGVVASVPANLGDMAMPGRPLVALYDPAALRVTAQLTEEQVRQLRAGGGVQVELTDRRLAIAASQVQVLPTADPLSHTVPVRVQLPADVRAVPGMFARLWWQGGAADASQRVLVPAQAVVRRAEMTGVYVQGQDGKPRLRQVRLGPPADAKGELVEVLSGLGAGDQVALEPQAAAKVR
ncbi:efflux RND transporter periplasmic adaptor subunit [Alicycliphilus denitrificans]|uniref:efflux RND transporter periplasmic adaptor subunit n=1 Tax=Alicycliphilus denitrificans TaxID=179636 RepID=UPI00384BD128